MRAVPGEQLCSAKQNDAIAVLTRQDPVAKTKGARLNFEGEIRDFGGSAPFLPS